MEDLTRQTTAQANGRWLDQVRKRQANELNIIEGPLAHLTDAQLEADVRSFSEHVLPSVSYDELLRAARVAKDIRAYYHVAKNPDSALVMNLPVRLTPGERLALCKERSHPFSERGMMLVIGTVSLAAFLQGFVQSSFNGASLVKQEWGLPGDGGHDTGTSLKLTTADWQLGAANASPWFFAALVGCPLSLPINYWFGRRGGMIFAAFMILASSVGSVFVTSWQQMFGVRIINGIGMGVKAVSTPILASETAVGFWRGSAILSWQLWVAFGIMIGFAFNLIFISTASSHTAYQLIQGSPIIPAVALLVVALFFCPESPRYHLMKGPNFSPERSYQMLLKIRNTRLQALRDIYAMHKSIEQEYMGDVYEDFHATLSPGFWWTMTDFFRQFRQLFQQRRLYNAVISTSTVNVSQQLCGINVLAFYSGTLLNRGGLPEREAMIYSLGFGAINFIFALPAIRSIDTIGRRRWLLMTLPLMAVFMAGAALSFQIKDDDIKVPVLAVFLFVFAAAYSPGLGPIPFTLASESFPLSHREAGTAWAIAINLGFAGVLAVVFPDMNSKLGNGGSLGLFSGLNVLAFIMVFLFVEETARRSLEDLDLIFAVSKKRFINFQVHDVLPWFLGRFFLGRKEPEPQFYRDLVWGSRGMEEMTRQVDLREGDVEMRETSRFGK